MNFKKIFKDKKGEIVIFQKPNLLVWIAIIFFILQYLFAGNLGTFALWGYRTTVFIWSLDEAFRGVNLFRRLLGVTVGLVLIITIIID
jgi:hypothetical protein